MSDSAQLFFDYARAVTEDNEEDQTGEINGAFDVVPIPRFFFLFRSRHGFLPFGWV